MRTGKDWKRGHRLIMHLRRQFLKNPGKYKSVSAFAPIANPSNCPWGQKAFSGYLDDKSEWADYDATELVKKWKGGPLDILIDVVRRLSFNPSCPPPPLTNTLETGHSRRLLPPIPAPTRELPEGGRGERAGRRGEDQIPGGVRS